MQFLLPFRSFSPDSNNLSRMSRRHLHSHFRRLPRRNLYSPTSTVPASCRRHTGILCWPVCFQSWITARGLARRNLDNTTSSARLMAIRCLGNTALAAFQLVLGWYCSTTVTFCGFGTTHLTVNRLSLGHFFILKKNSFLARRSPERCLLLPPFVLVFRSASRLLWGFRFGCCFGCSLELSSVLLGALEHGCNVLTLAIAQMSPSLVLNFDMLLDGRLICFWIW